MVCLVVAISILVVYGVVGFAVLVRYTFGFWIGGFCGFCGWVFWVDCGFCGGCFDLVRFWGGCIL